MIPSEWAASRIVFSALDHARNGCYEIVRQFFLTDSFDDDDRFADDATADDDDADER